VVGLARLPDIGKNMAGLNEDTISAARKLEHIDAKTDAALRFVNTIVVKRGKLTDADVASGLTLPA